MKVSLHDLLQVAPIMRPRAQSREQGTSGLYREWTTTQRAIIHLAAEILDVSFEDLVKIAFLLRPVDAGVHSRGGADIRSADDNTSSTQQLITDVLPATTGPMVSDPSLFSDGLAEGTPLTSGAAGNPLTQATAQPANQDQSTSPLPELDIDSDFGEDLSDFDTEDLWDAETDFGSDLVDMERTGTPG
ncbi:hypothetical protein SAPIO_CDS9514 [Scedosporium apiospermum]|uniref:Uncharacterized protein n=1 Tax=Pseudallescheria apiosperma TaxID=563466 RepID=A0A084FWY7_PSEDA|nr:uncharacterized protein SAPIO_CDS9514 [Scedosporium apiospermum]KEZ39599.1 hypothetical protein SAPIO_CDS9514 [Scedosporium apiospermum]